MLDVWPPANAKAEEEFRSKASGLAEARTVNINYPPEALVVCSFTMN